MLKKLLIGVILLGLFANLGLSFEIKTDKETYYCINGVCDPVKITIIPDKLDDIYKIVIAWEQEKGDILTSALSTDLRTVITKDNFVTYDKIALTTATTSFIWKFSATGEGKFNISAYNSLGKLVYRLDPTFKPWVVNASAVYQNYTTGNIWDLTDQAFINYFNVSGAVPIQERGLITNTSIGNFTNTYYYRDGLNLWNETESFSITMWLQRNSTGGGATNQYFLSSGTGFKLDASFVGSQNRVRWQTSACDTLATVTPMVWSVDGSWTLYTFIHDAVNGECTTYFNTTLNGNITTAGGTTGRMTTLNIGVSQDRTGGDVVDFFINQIVFWNKTLSAGDIEWFYNLGAGQEPEEPLETNITFVSQVPADISSINIFNTVLNVTYNISGTDLNYSSVVFYYKINNTETNNRIYINGSEYGGERTGNVEITNESELWSFAVWDNQVYPATYNINELYMEIAPKENYTLSNQAQYIKTKLFNISNNVSYGFFEVYAWNETFNMGGLRLYYCNSSYTTGLPTINDNCASFGSILASVNYNHSHFDNTSHFVVPFGINTTTGEFNEIKVTETSYILLRGTNSGNWNIAHISNISRADQIQTSSNSGTSWVNFDGTLDLHIHQFYSNDAFNYRACIENNDRDLFCSANRSDLLDLGGLPPTAPDVYAPISATYSGMLDINYTASISPNSYNIDYYNITLVNSSLDWIYTIIANNSINLSYSWNSSEVPNGDYIIRVQVWDNISQTNYGYSDGFTIYLPPILDYTSIPDVFGDPAYSVCLDNDTLYKEYLVFASADSGIITFNRSRIISCEWGCSANACNPAPFENYLNMFKMFLLIIAGLIGIFFIAKYRF